MVDYPDLTPEEQSFRDMLQSPRELSKWARKVRAEWHASPAGLLAIRRWERENGRKWER